MRSLRTYTHHDCTFFFFLIVFFLFLLFCAGSAYGTIGDARVDVLTEDVVCWCLFKRRAVQAVLLYSEMVQCLLVRSVRGGWLGDWTLVATMLRQQVKACTFCVRAAG